MNSRIAEKGKSQFLVLVSAILDKHVFTPRQTYASLGERYDGYLIDYETNTEDNFIFVQKYLTDTEMPSNIEIQYNIYDQIKQYYKIILTWRQSCLNE